MAVSPWSAVAAGGEHVSYFQVDNPIVRALDPEFLGLHASAGHERAPSSGEMSSKMIPKAYAEEKLGVFCGAWVGPAQGARGDR